MAQQPPSDRGPHGHFLKGHSIRKPTKVKKLRQEAKALEQGKQAGARRPFMERLEDKILDMVGRIDPVELAAIGGATLLVHGIIKSSGEIMEGVIKTLLIPQDLIQAFYDWIAGEKTVLPPVDFTRESINVWLYSFVIAFIIVRAAPGILQSGMAGIQAFVGGFFKGA